MSGPVVAILIVAFLCGSIALGAQQQKCSPPEGARIQGVYKEGGVYRIGASDLGDPKLLRRLSSPINALSAKGCRLVKIELTQRDQQSVKYLVEFSEKVSDQNTQSVVALIEEMARIEFGYEQGRSQAGMIVSFNNVDDAKKLEISVSTKGVRIFGR